MDKLKKIYDLVNAKLGSQHTTNIAVADFNVIFCEVQIEFQNELVQKRETSTQQDLMYPFKELVEVPVVGGIAEYPDDYADLLEAYHLVDGQMVSSKPHSTHEIAKLESSCIRKADLGKKVAYHDKYKDGLHIYPTDAPNINLVYYRCPKDVSLVSSYKESKKGDYRVINNGGIDMCWDRKAIPYLVQKIVMAYSLQLQDTSLYQKQGGIKPIVND